jgi:WD40 repeat protein
MLKDTLNKRLMFGTKLGEIYIYDISLAEKPKILATLQNHNKGSIRCLHLDTNRNYLFAAGYDDGEINVFEMDKPGREKYAKMTAFMKGK